jgi:hypothetical protein
MTRRKIVATGIAALLALATTTVPATAQTAPRGRVIGDTGLVTLGPDQVLRLSVFHILPYIEQDNLFKLATLRFAPGACPGGACPHELVSDELSPAMTVSGPNGMTVDIPAGASSGVRAVVHSQSRRLRVTATIVDANTNQIIAILIG